jgi:hypothetical protein
MDEPETPTEAGQVAPESGSSIILASFENRDSGVHRRDLLGGLIHEYEIAA